MTTQTLIHSNAFNFLSFVQGSVDPRTGFYSLAIALPELPANHLSGPNLPLSLRYNPLNIQDSGFGVGWSLNLTQFDVTTGMLGLHTGESFKVADNGPGQTAVIPERKIDSFHFENVSEGAHKRVRIAHKSGLIEVLEPQAPDYSVALPVRVLAASGHGISLSYRVVNGAPCLETITDDTLLDGRPRTLLAIDYSGNAQVKIDLNPGTEAFARYTLERSGDELGKVVLPTADQACWAFTYRRVGELRCLTAMQTPVGAREVIEYKDDGHALPGGQGRTVPYVRRHVISPGAGQPDVETHYAFSSNNFLGNGTGVSWDNDGLDNLYKFTGSRFVYSSTASHYQDGAALRTITREFNRFHLLTAQVTTQQGCIETATTIYHELSDLPFADQPEHFQLPQTVTTEWRLQGNPQARRSEVTATDYDTHGNLIREVQANGMQTHYSYYPATQSQGCPRDPEGFVRTLKSQVQLPAADGEGQAEALRRDYTYIALAALDAQAKGELLQDSEVLVRVSDGTVLSRTQVEYAAALADPLLHGRRLSEMRTLGGKRTRTDYRYAQRVVDRHPVVETVATRTGFDKTQKVTTLHHSVLIGEPLLNYDDNQVQIAYEYDPLRRVVRETVSPNEEAFKAARAYSYYLSATGNQAVQVMTDVKGVTTWSYVDGLNRVVRQMRQDPDYATTRLAQEAPRLSYSARYDALGNLCEEIEHEWLALDDLPLRTRFEYDGWGQRSCVIGPDGVRNHEQVDPIGTPESNGPILTQWRESADGRVRTGKTVIWNNLFDKPVRVERLRCDDARESLHQYFYDGLGRTAREIDGRGAQTAFAYDEFDRLHTHTLADGAQVLREYAEHSDEDLPVLIKVRHADGATQSVLGEQVFDGLDRMVETITGGRRRVLQYADGMRQPESVVTPSGQVVRYEYLPQLGEEPLQRAVIGSGVEARYDYDKHNARLLYCKEQGEELSRTYFSTGQVRSEARVQEGTRYEMAYVHSLAGRLLSYTDVLGQVQSYSYNPLGQLEQTSLGTLTSTFSYDALGRNTSITTQTRDADEAVRSVQITLDYDDFERETARHFDFGDAQQVLAQTYDAVDAIVTKTLSEGGQRLREEAYTYDERGRLTHYECEGEDAYVPVDPYGKKIQIQRFDLDALDNITRVRTRFEGGTIDARYQFDNALDPAQLTGIEVRGLEETPRRIVLDYDLDGNLVLDEEGRELQYDALGRLHSVKDEDRSTIALYGYDPLDRLAMQQTL